MSRKMKRRQHSSRAVIGFLAAVGSASESTAVSFTPGRWPAGLLVGLSVLAWLGAVYLAGKHES